jgi:hypothetical protein
MGRHYKGVAEALNMLAQWTIEQREREERAKQLPDEDKRVLFRAFAARRQKAIDENSWHIPERPGYLTGLTCGARTRSGKQCRMTALEPNGRCKWHGGKSTGPRSPEGQARALENLRLGRLKRGKS